MICENPACQDQATHAVVVFVPTPLQVRVCEPHADEALEHGGVGKIPVEWTEKGGA